MHIRRADNVLRYDKANLSRKEEAVIIPTEVKITQYEDEEFLITILESETSFEARLSHKALAVSELMFELLKENSFCPNMTIELFINIVQANLPRYKEIFVEKYLTD